VIVGVKQTLTNPSGQVGIAFGEEEEEGSWRMGWRV
jgi:hypothetical protein